MGVHAKQGIPSAAGSHVNNVDVGIPSDLNWACILVCLHANWQIITCWDLNSRARVGKAALSP